VLELFFPIETVPLPKARFREPVSAPRVALRLFRFTVPLSAEFMSSVAFCMASALPMTRLPCEERKLPVKVLAAFRLSVPAVTMTVPLAPVIGPLMVWAIPALLELKVAPSMSRLPLMVTPVVLPSAIMPELPVAVTGPDQVRMRLFPPPVRRLAPLRASVLPMV